MIGSTAFHFDEAYNHTKAQIIIIPIEKNTALSIFNHANSKIG
ncbi:hypothetical protein [Bacillus sp. mrc49]|nr:hypothetical protein [Bacillus sp. mrc49]